MSTVQGKVEWLTSLRVVLPCRSRDSRGTGDTARWGVRGHRTPLGCKKAELGAFQARPEGRPEVRVHTGYCLSPPARDWRGSPTSQLGSQPEHLAGLPKRDNGAASGELRRSAFLT